MLFASPRCMVICFSILFVSKCRRLIQITHNCDDTSVLSYTHETRKISPGVIKFMIQCKYSFFSLFLSTSLHFSSTFQDEPFNCFQSYQYCCSSLHDHWRCHDMYRWRQVSIAVSLINPVPNPSWQCRFSQFHPRYLCHVKYYIRLTAHSIANNDAVFSVS